MKNIFFIASLLLLAACSPKAVEGLAAPTQQVPASCMLEVRQPPAGWIEDVVLIVIKTRGTCDWRAETFRGVMLEGTGFTHPDPGKIWFSPESPDLPPNKKIWWQP